MKKLFIIMLMACSGTTFAQQDSTKKEADTIRIGGIVIVKKEGEKNQSIKLSPFTAAKKNKNVTTNWWMIDIGFSGVRDLTDYTSAEAKAFMPSAGATPINAGDFSLRTTRVSNFNLWIFMRKHNILKHVLNLKYGLGIESNNYFYKSSLTYVDAPTSYVMRETISYSKNKLVTNYLTVPLLLNINTSPNSKKKGLEISAGISGGLLTKAYQKQKSDERGKQKQHKDFNIERFKVALVGELGIGPVKFYGSYSLTPLHKYGVEQMPYNVGFRLGNL